MLKTLSKTEWWLMDDINKVSREEVLVFRKVRTGDRRYCLYGQNELY